MIIVNTIDVNTMTQ